MLKRITFIGAVLGVLATTTALAEPTLEGLSSPVAGSVRTGSVAQPAAKPETFRPTVATTPDYNAAPWWPNSMAQ